MPGHAGSWGAADKSILCSCNDVIQPFNDLTYEYIESYLKDVFDALFLEWGFDPIIHLGGDEVNSGCFNADQKVVSEMAKRGYSTR